MNRPWLVTITSILAGISIAAAQNKVVPCLGVLQDVFAIDKASAGWLSSVFSVMGILMAFPTAMLTRWLGAKRACVLSLSAAITGGIIGLWASTFPLLLISRMIEGFGAGMIAVAVPTIIAHCFPIEKRGLPTGIWSSWQFVAQALCFFFAPAILQRWDWHGVWWAGIIFCGAMGIASQLIIHLPQEGTQNTPQRTQEPPAASIRRVMVQLPVLATCMAMFCFCFACFGFVTWAPSCWTEQLGFTSTQANWLISLFAMISIPAVIIAGGLIDRVSRKKMGVISCWGYGIMAGAAFFMPSPIAMLPFALIYPFFEGAASTCLWTMISQAPRNAQDLPTAIALFNLASNCGMLLGPPAAGSIIQCLGWHALSAVLIFVMLAGGLCFTYIQSASSSCPQTDGTNSQ
ncbi:MFS transporter [Lawsonibacter sp. LCP25S3_G6]|uniref:MFS transporter n=1 Tax=unclassified Lawsonibacter TaxID=2617946 RepID=UPI003F9462CA